MKTKAKKFSHKLLALFMAVLMAASCFTGALTAYADTMSSEKTYADESIEYNDKWYFCNNVQKSKLIFDTLHKLLTKSLQFVYNLTPKNAWFSASKAVILYKNIICRLSLLTFLLPYVIIIMCLKHILRSFWCNGLALPTFSLIQIPDGQRLWQAPLQYVNTLLFN